MKYGKLPLLYQEQLDLLISRNLTCNDQKRALEWLRRIGYYRLSAYYIPFRVPGSDQFQPGTTFDQIVDLYKFDSNLRLLVMQAIDRIEVAFRAILTYHLAHDLGTYAYANPANFFPRYDHGYLLKAVATEEKRSTELFVKHFRTKYTSESCLPLWMATELITFGALSKMFEALDIPLRKKVAGEFGIQEPVFTSWMHTLTEVRNTCAHHSRLWNRVLGVKPKLPTDWWKQGLNNQRFYTVALLIQALLTEVSPHSRWGERLKNHFNTYPSVDLAAMHFPANWQTLPPWA